MWNGGVLTTAANLVFQGTGDGRLKAYRADSGEQLWETPTRTGVIAPPISYRINGEQYVAVMAGWGGAPTLAFNLPGSKSGANGRLLVYKLGGKAELPAPPEAPVTPTPPPRHGTDESIAKGQVLYNTHCGRCHGLGLESSGLLPDLRDMGHDMTAATPEVFKAIVLQGAYVERGMVSFADVLSEADAEALYDYVVDAAHSRWEEEQSPPLWREIETWFMDLAGALIAQFI